MLYKNQCCIPASSLFRFQPLVSGRLAIPPCRYSVTIRNFLSVPVCLSEVFRFSSADRFLPPTGRNSYPEMAWLLRSASPECPGHLGGGGISARSMVSLRAYLLFPPFSAAGVCACVRVWRGSSNRSDTSFPARLLMWSSGSVGAVCGPLGSRELFHNSFLSRLHVACRWPGPVWCGM
jgi:hypothetical protein